MALFAGALVIALNKFGLVPRNFFRENAQRRAIIELEQKVGERTANLRDAMAELVAVNTKLSLQMRVFPSLLLVLFPDQN